MMRVLLYNGYGKGSLLADFSDRWDSLSWSTALHGGFRDCRLTVPMRFLTATQGLRFESNAGYHFRHLEITEGSAQAPHLRWEGRVMGVAAHFEGMLEIRALGYWASCRDQRVTTLTYNDTVDDIIKDMLTNFCPDVNIDQAGIADLQAEGAINITWNADQYTQDHIVDSLAPLGDSSNNVYYFAIWDARKPHYAARDMSAVDWEARLEDLASAGGIDQDASWMRNEADAHDGNTANRTASGAETAPAHWPTRDALVQLPSGTSSAAMLLARDTFLDERHVVQQQTQFTIAGHIVARSKGARDRLGQRQAMRAGDVVKVVDIIPAGVASPALDQIRTFYIVATEYSAHTDTVQITVDRPASRLEVLLSRIEQLEPTRSA